MTSLNQNKSITSSVIVHVVEARHLVAKDSNNLSDPFVRVTVAGKRQDTDIRRNQISATWDQVFMFQDITMTLEEFEKEIILLEVYDANTFVRNELIGQFVFGLSKVRNMPGPYRHQAFDKWVILTNPEDPAEEQGYLRVTVTVLGPGDVPPSHERAEDFVLARSQRAPKEEKILSAPNVKRRGYSFAVKVFRAEFLPITDTWNKTCDPFVVVRFNGVVSRTPHARQTVSPNWNYLLVLPIFTPCFADTIEIQLWDFVRGQPDRHLATSKVSFTSLLGESLPPHWFHFYGRVDERNSASNWFCDVVRRTHADVDETAYMGSALISLNTNLVEEPQRIERPTAPIKGPKTTRYVLWVDVLQTSELPLSIMNGQAMVEVEFGPESNKRSSDWCTASSADHLIEFTASGTNLSSSSSPDKDGKGACQFAEIQANLPLIDNISDEPHSNQFYDIVINVYVSGLFGGVTRVGYLRLKPTEVLGFNNTPEWHPIVGLLDRNGESVTPGHLLLSLSFGTLQEKLQMETAKGVARFPIAVTDSKDTGRYTLRAHIYQARSLVPSHDDGLVSSQVQVTLAGKNAVLKVSPHLYSTGKEGSVFDIGKDSNQEDQHDIPRECTRIAINTLNPVWYESLEIPQLEMSLRTAQDIKVKVLGPNEEILGQVSIPSSMCTKERWPANKRPRWFRLNKNNLSTFRTRGVTGKKKRNHLKKAGLEGEEHNDLMGYILIKLELLQLDVDTDPVAPVWAHRWPTVRPCEFNLATIGLRGLEEYGLFFGSIDNPQVEIHIQSTPNMGGPLAFLAQNRSVTALNINQAESTTTDTELYEHVSFVCGKKNTGKFIVRGNEVSVSSVDQLTSDYYQLNKTSFGRKLFQNSDFKGDKNGVFTWYSEVQVHEVKKSTNQSSDDEDMEDEELGLANSVMPLANSIEETHRAKFTFFHEEKILINMPTDPFYAPSLTIIVKDDRAMSTPIIATATVSTRDFASTFLYTEEMIQIAKAREMPFDIPMFANSDETRRKLQENAEDESDDELDETLFDKITGFQEEEDQVSENEVPESDNEEDPTDEKSPFDQDFMFDSPHEGYKDMPLAVTKDVDFINVVFDDAFLMDQATLTEVVVEDEEEEDDEELDGFDSRPKPKVNIAWPMEEIALETVRTYNLEDSPDMHPKPFRSFQLFRGTISDNNHQLAGTFKAGIVIRPKEGDFFEELRIVNQDYDGSTNAMDDSNIQYTQPVKTWDFVLLKKNDSAHPKITLEDPQMEENTEMCWVSKLSKYRPMNMIEFEFQGYIPTGFVRECGYPSDILYRSPDVEFAIEEAHRRQKDFNMLTDCRVQPIASTMENPQTVKVRVYIVAASQLAAKSMMDSLSDPYIIVKLNMPTVLKETYTGVSYHNDRANFKPSTLDPFFGTWFELDARFPDITELDIEVWNANYLNDDLIGSTRVDLEDRWFNPKWHNIRYERKKIKEFRSIHTPGSQVSQGLLECWVEMYTPEESVNAPVVDIRVPKTEEWELRLVVWETRRVPIVEDMNYANLWVSGELFYEGLDGKKHFNDESYETDTHTGLKDGRGIYNYRMKFSMEAPCKFPRLLLKVFSRHFVSSKVVGESSIDISWLMREASISNADFIDRPRSWVGLTHSSTGLELRGELDIQMSLVRKKYADEHPVGNAQDPPNENPYLPEPPRESFFAAVFRSVGWGKSLCCIITTVLVLILVLILVLKVL